ncbi:MAG TPA: serine/threonine-protein kinase [Herpetosiphonaceae bacterium]
MSAASPTTPPLLHGRYRILARLGESRLATVYHAEDERLKRKVLVHLLRAELVQQPNLRQRFEEEAQRGAQRTHPGLLDVYDTGDVGGRPYMVTEDIAGRSLAEAGMISASEALSAVRTIVGAVALAQTQGVPHPPISSRNVWLLPGGRTLLVESWHVPTSQIPLELAPYRAPERLTGGPPSPATTVYALGLLAWEAFVGHRPFGGATPDEIARQQRQGDLPTISQARPAIFSPELDRIVAQAVAVDPGMRYPTPTDFGRALDHYADATTAQTGRLAALPHAWNDPTTISEQRSSRLRLPRRRAQTATAPAIAPPPPPPVIAEPPPETRTVVRPRPAPLDQRTLDKQIQHHVRREVRRQGCQRALIKRSLQLLFVFLLLYGGYLGLRYAVDYTTGRIQQIDVGEWISRQLPDPNDFIPSWLRDPGSVVASYRVIAPTNLRERPGATEDNPPIRVLEPGVRLQQIGVAQPDPQGGPYEWLPVITLDNATSGWIANLQNNLEQE